MNSSEEKRQKKWDIRFLRLCKEISSWSKDPSTQVGAIITNGIKVVSIGYNGLPQNTPDLPEILKVRQLKYKYILHAETNAILTSQGSVKGCTMYTFPLFPCCRCASMLIQAGISRVVSVECQDDRWKKQLEESKHFMSLSKVEIIEYPIDAI
tara:strand:- start:268 stop:726 length:459 start_codon:yes stop_codon:yes gene_type:complete